MLFSWSLFSIITSLQQVFALTQSTTDTLCICRISFPRIVWVLRFGPGLATILNTKASNDLALWLYIYNDDGMTVPVMIMGLMAVATNVPLIAVRRRLRVSFAYNAANYYIGTFTLVRL